MEREEMIRIIKELEGIKFYEWQLFKSCIDKHFEETEKDNTLIFNKSVIKMSLLYFD